MRFHGLKLGAAAFAAAMFATPALASEPIDRSLGLQPSASDVAAQVAGFHNFLLVIITAIVIFVLALLLIVILRFNSKANPKPASFSHNTLLEVAWTTLPVMILIAIAFPSFPLLFTQDVEPTQVRGEAGEIRELTADDWVTMKVYGRQWYWSYEYETGDEDVVQFDSRMIPDETVKVTPGARRNLSADNPFVVPLGKHVRVNIAASDVIHSFAIPAFRFKVDAIPGRLNQLWFKPNKTGVYYGQCSELCGRDHAFMPIELRVVPQDVYDQWLTLAKDDIEQATAYLNEAFPRPLQPVDVASLQ